MDRNILGEAMQIQGAKGVFGRSVIVKQSENTMPHTGRRKGANEVSKLTGATA